MYPDRRDEISIAEFFVILNWSYQMGVFVSRSSLQYVKIKNVWVLCGFQLINWIFLFINTKFLLVTSLWVLCPIFVWTGLMGGGCYVNVMHNILELDTLAENEREAAIVMSLMSNDIGVLSSAIFTLVIDNTLFKFDS